MRSSSSRRSSLAYSLSTGTRAALSIPPMSSSYTILGTLLTASNAAVPPLTPKVPAMTLSRTNPSRRLPTFPRALIPAARAMPAWARVVWIAPFAGTTVGSTNASSYALSAIGCRHSAIGCWLLAVSSERTDHL